MFRPRAPLRPSFPWLDAASARARFDPRAPAAACALLALSLAAGCDACSKEPKVPFKLGQEQDAEPLPDAGAQRAETKNYAAAVDHPVVDDEAVPLNFVRALLAHDLDGDGDRDVLALVHDPLKRLRLVTCMREPKAFAEAVEVDGFSAPGSGDCSLHFAQLSTLSDDKAVATIAFACGDPPTPQPASFTFLSLEAPPRVHDRIELVGERAGTIDISPSSVDADGDGHSDIVLDVTLVSGAPPAPTPDASAAGSVLKLAWLDRPSGLSRDLREPDATFSAWANAAQSLLAKKPEQALQQAGRVVALEAALCRERGEAALLVSGVPGIACKPSKGVSSALATLVLAHARLKHVAEALEAYAELARRELKPDKRTLERVLAALPGLPRQQGISMREGPAVEVARAPRVRLPAARFVDESTLLVRRSEPVLYNLDSGQETALSVATDDLVRDPAGELAVTDIERTGCGLRLRIERAPKVASLYLPGPALASPWLLSFGPSCSSDGSAPRPDSGGFQVLGWAPQGVVATRGREVRVVPLSTNGSASAEPFRVLDDAPLPAPLPAGVATPDGARRVELTPAGVLVFARGAEAPELWRPDGFAGIAQSAREAAISPQGRHVTVVAEGTVYVLSREAGR